MAAGPISPVSAYPVDAGWTFPYFYTGGGANSKQEEGLGVAASVNTASADVTWRLRFPMPPAIPTGTLKLRLLGLANATSGTAKITVKDATVSAGASPSGASLTSETQLSLTWAAGDNDKYKEGKVTLTPSPAANDMLVVDLVFNTTGYTLAQILTIIPTVLWE